MRYEFNLTRTGVGDGGTLSWDSATGELSGELAAEMEERLSGAEQDGSVTSHPYPTEYKLTDPRHDPGQFAVVLGCAFAIPQSLRAAIEEFMGPPDNHEGSDVPLVY